MDRQRRGLLKASLALGVNYGQVVSLWGQKWRPNVEVDYDFQDRTGNPKVTLRAGFALLLWRARLALHLYRWQRRPGEGVVVWRGAWWHREVWIPMARLQHLDIKRGPLERWLGLATLELYTAGSHAYETRLPGLEPQQAQALRDGLLAELQDPAAPGQGAAA